MTAAIYIFRKRFLPILLGSFFSAHVTAGTVSIEYSLPLDFSFPANETRTKNIWQTVFVPAMPSSLANSSVDVRLTFDGTGSHTITAQSDMPGPNRSTLDVYARPTQPLRIDADSLIDDWTLDEGQAQTFNHTLYDQSNFGPATQGNGFILDATNEVGYKDIEWRGQASAQSPIIPISSGEISGVATVRYEWDETLNPLTPAEIAAIEARQGVSNELIECVTGCPNPTDVSWLRALFVFTADLIDRDGPKEPCLLGVECFPAGGIRGDAEQYVRDDLLNNPDTTLIG